MHFSLWVLVLPLPFDFTFSFSFRFADPIEWIWIHPFMLLSAVLNMPSNYGKIFIIFNHIEVYNEWLDFIRQRLHDKIDCQFILLGKT